MNICFFTSEYPNMFSGGVERVTYDLSLSFIAIGHNVHVISVSPLKVQNNNSVSFPGLVIGDNFENLRKTIDYLKENEIDIIINQSHQQIVESYLVEIRKYLKIKLIKVLHTDPAAVEKAIVDKYPILSKHFAYFIFIKLTNLIRKRKRHKYLVRQYNLWLGFYDKIVLLSNSFIPVFLSYINDFKLNKIISIPNPLSLNNNNNIDVKKEKIVIFVGRLCKEAKRPDRLIYIWEKIYKNNVDWKLIIIGDGNMRIDLQNYCYEKNISNIEFVGQVDPTPFYQKASILCVTSTYEGFSLVINEALFYRVVPFAFESFQTVNDLIINDKTGFIIRPFNLKEYASKLNYLMHSDDKLIAMRNDISTYFDYNKYDIKTITSLWNSLFENL